MVQEPVAADDASVPLPPLEALVAKLTLRYIWRIRFHFLKLGITFGIFLLSFVQSSSRIFTLKTLKKIC